MHFNYCPKCAGVDVVTKESGLQQCLKCNYTGDMRKGDMAEINSHRKSVVRNQSSETAVHQPKHVQKPVEDVASKSAWKSKLTALKGKKNNDFEFM